MNDQPAKPRRCYVRKLRRRAPFMEDGARTVQDAPLHDEGAIEVRKTDNTDIVKAGEVLSARARAIGTADGIITSGFTWAEQIESVIEMARNTANPPDVRMAAWREVTHIAEKAARDLIAERLVGGMEEGDFWRKLTEAAISKQVQEGDMDAVRTVIQSGRVEGWKPEPAKPGIAVQINSYAGLSQDKIERLRELDALIHTPLPAPPNSDEPLDVAVVENNNVETDLPENLL